MARFIHWCVLFPALTFALGCTTHRPPQVPPPDPQGQSSFDFLQNGAAIDRDPPRDQEFRPPMLAEEPLLPVYPEAVLAAGVRPAIVVERIEVDAEGRVAAVADSPRQPSTDGPYCDEFRRAVEEALSQWVFYPAVFRRFEPGEDLDGDGVDDYRRMIDSRNVTYYLDVRFDFEIVDGQGHVNTNQNAHSVPDPGFVP